MKSLKGKLLLRITVAILVVEAMLLAVSLEYHRRELVGRYQPPQGYVAFKEMPAEERAEIRQYLSDYAARITIAIGVVVVGTISLLYFLLNPLVIRPVRRIVRANDAMAEGHADEEIPKPDMPDDDLGEIMRSRARVFELFYTTKTAERGTGLGLAIVRDIADRIGAVVSCDSKPGEGTTFVVRFRTAAGTGAPTGEGDIAHV